MLAMPSNNEENQTLLGFDFGLKRIGVAVGQTITRTATPLQTLQAHNGIPDWEKITALVKEWQPSAIVVGIPWNMDGTPQAITESAQQFAQSLEKHTGLPVHRIDERLSTKEARQRLFDVGGYREIQKSQIDSYAAKLILESWLKNS